MNNNNFFRDTLQKSDLEMYNAIQKELKRQQNNIELIASENIVSKAVLEASGSILTNKYAEGYPNRRYYGGCECVDVVEQIVIDRAKELFNCKYANVQAHSGSQANFAVYLALLNPGDTIMGMDLNCGGHLTHGSNVSVSGKYFNVVSYTIDKETHTLNYKEIEDLAIKHKPKLIICGASAYSRIIDFEKFKKIADKISAYLMADIAHIAGLVATGHHPSPLPYAHVTTSTTHKTLRGPRGGLILTNDAEISKKINSAIFPGSQGGPLEHIIAAKGVAFKEALSDDYKKYIEQVVINTKVMCNEFIKNNIPVVSQGTDNHLFMLDVTYFGINGKIAQNILDDLRITCNKNSLPFDILSPNITSGIRIGAAAVTTRGFKEKEVIKVAELIIKALSNIDKDTNMLNSDIKQEILGEVENLCNKFPIYS